MSSGCLAEDIPFVACTQPATVAGVTMEAIALNVMFSWVLLLLAGSIVYAIVAIPIHLDCRLICRYDPNTFRVLFAWLETRGRARWPYGADRPARLFGSSPFEALPTPDAAKLQAGEIEPRAYLPLYAGI